VKNLKFIGIFHAFYLILNGLLSLYEPKFIIIDPSGIENVNIASYTSNLLDRVQIVGNFHVLSLVLGLFSAIAKLDFFSKFNQQSPGPIKISLPNFVKIGW